MPGTQTTWRHAPTLGTRPQGVIKQLLRIGSTRLRYRCKHYHAGIRLELESDRGDWLRATVRVKAPAVVQLDEEVVSRKPGRRYRPWALDVLHTSFRGPGASRVQYLADTEELFERVRSFARQVDSGWCLSSRRQAQREHLRRLLADAVRAVVSRCDPGALGIARRFHPLARFFVYRQLLEDASGRVRQLTRTCPGALVFAAGLGAHGGLAGETARDLFREVVAGGKLSRALGKAVQGFLLNEAALEQKIRRGSAPGPASTLLDGCSDEVTSWVDRMRLLVRRAGPRVSPLDLCAMPPPRFAPEDIPRDARTNTQWYAAVRVAVLAAEHEIAPGAWSFLSRNAVALFDMAAARAAVPLARDTRAEGFTLARDALAYSEATSKWPQRSTSAEAWLSCLQSWLDQQDRLAGPAERLGRLLEKLRGLDLGEVESILSLKDDLGWDETAGPVFPTFDKPPDVRIPGVDLRPIRTALELAAEGHRMGNCVAAYCGGLVRGGQVRDGLVGGRPVRGRLVRGGRWIFTGSVEQEPATVEVVRVAERYALEDARGFEDRELSASAWSALRRWGRALNGEEDCREARTP